MVLKLRSLFKAKANDEPASTPVGETFARAQSLQKSGDFEAAIRLYDELLGDKGSDAEIHYKRANAFNSLGRWETALAGYDRAIALDPTFAHAFCNRGAVLERLERWSDALSSYDRAIALNPGDGLTYYNRGSVLKAQQRLDEALGSYDQAIARRPDYVEAYINRGHVLQGLRRHKDAVASYDKAIDLSARYVEAFQGRGLSLLDLGRHEAAIASYNQALVLDADQKYLLGVRRHAQMKICDWSGLDADMERLAEGVRALKPVCTPFAMLSLVDSPELHSLTARIWAQQECPPDEVLGTIPASSRGGKIRIGYFSADFRTHPVSLLAAELFESHDRSQFETIAFAFGREADDFTRGRLQKAFDRFVDVRDRSDREVAVLAREIGVDIAVDLSGFTEGNRTGIFALRAAPVQVSFLGYPGTMATAYMDYLIGDRAVISPEVQRYCTEKIVYLPDSFLPNDSTRVVADTVYSREQLGLPKSGFVFCCFNNAYKITPAVFDGWMRILSRTTGSVLWLAQNNPESMHNLRMEAARRGVDARRLVFADRWPSAAEHLARHRAAGLFLDTTPYNAHATASDALWTGLPVLTCPGEGFAGRVAASLLRAIDLPELVAATTAEYEDLAVNLAMDADLLEGVRQKLARNRVSAPLFDTARFTRNLESAYTRMHARNRAALPPDHVFIEPSA